MLTKLMHAGMDVARLNFSHGNHAGHGQVISDLRSIAAEMHRPLAILQDLSGPKMRIGELGIGVHLKRNQVVGLVVGENSHPHESTVMIPVPLPELLSALTPGRTLLLDDGKITLRVTECACNDAGEQNVVYARCLTGGTLTSRKGIAAPGVKINVPSATDKDLDDLRFGLENGIDLVAVSFVRSCEDLKPIFAVMDEVGIRRPVLAKIEKSEAVHNFASILKMVDGIMVARGDLGVEMAFDEVPIVQKHLIKQCNQAAKPVITATQMLESMLSCPRPTRAEATDVANAILDGTDAVMLSGETASGEFPVEAVKTMAQIARRAEEAFFHEDTYAQRLGEPDDVTAAVSRATASIAGAVKASAIICATTSGGTARQVASRRPNVPILAVTNEATTYHSLALTWGVEPCLVNTVHNTDAMMEATLEAAQLHKLVAHGDRVVLTAGVPVNRPGTTNLIRVHTVGNPL
jgi:pyruvate kinase